MLNTPHLIPLSLYIHIPWCVRKCPYCDFNSHQVRDEIPESAYVDRLIADLDNDLPKVKGRSLTSIFFGGGTPSLFSAEAIFKILTAVKERIACENHLEVTLEANPGTVDQSRFAEFKNAGINRLSIGIQSFQEDKLLALGRIHDRKAAIVAVEAAHIAGFENFNLDLMFGLPKQSQQEAIEDLKTAIALAPTHLSWYQLTIEPNTFFHRHPPILPSDELTANMQEEGQALLANAEFLQYETSAYSKESRECRHNINYWEFGDYLGIGAGAHSKITSFPSHTVTRAVKCKHPRDYLDANRHFISHTENVSIADLAFEFMLNAFRLHRDLPLTLFESRTGISSNHIRAQLQSAQEKGFVVCEKEVIRTTPFGRRFLNDLVGMFLE